MKNKDMVDCLRYLTARIERELYTGYVGNFLDMSTHPEKCECGAKVAWGDKCKEWQHSTYCPLYREDRARSGKMEVR